MSDGPPIDAARVLADLRELQRLTGDAGGAQRLAWGETWREARRYLTGLLAEIGIASERDEAGNLWARLDGEDGTAPALALGSHVDSVPDGGWLDGALGVFAALGVLRAWAAADRPPIAIELVDWADEEGARFGRSLFGSSAYSGSLEPAAVADLRDSRGARLEDVLAENGVALERVVDASQRMPAGAYLELHIEQGPVLEGEGFALAAVSGCAGVERRRLRFRGQAAHAGTTPMELRHDAGLAAAEVALAVERVAREHGGVATTGSLTFEPGIATAVAGVAELSVDIRHRQADALAAMATETLAAANAVARRRGCVLEQEPVWQIEPIPFDPEIVAIALEEVRGLGGRPEPLASGALHDAAEVARRSPAAMIFCPSKGGLSHSVAEDTDEADLLAAIEAYGNVANRLANR